MEEIIKNSKELDNLRIVLVNNGFQVGESEWSNTLYAVRENGRFQNGLNNIAIEYWPGNNKFLIMGRWYTTPDEVISFLKA